MGGEIEKSCFERTGILDGSHPCRSRRRIGVLIRNRVEFCSKGSLPNNICTSREQKLTLPTGPKRVEVLCALSVMHSVYQDVPMEQVETATELRQSGDRQRVIDRRGLL